MARVPRSYRRVAVAAELETDAGEPVAGIVVGVAHDGAFLAAIELAPEGARGTLRISHSRFEKTFEVVVERCGFHQALQGMDLRFIGLEPQQVHVLGCL